jgi:hypothetical protein
VGIDMETISRAETIANATVAAYAAKGKRLDPPEVETLMRPFGPISYEVERQVGTLLRSAGTSLVDTGIGPWIEVNDAVSGEGRMVPLRVEMLVNDPLEPLLIHLPAAIEHATKKVHPLIVKLFESKYLQK